MPRESSESPDLRALRLATAAGRLAGAEVLDARLLRVRRSVHVELPRAGVVARVEAPGDESVAEMQAWAARLLAERGAPTARLFRPELQPLVLAEGAVTLWHRLEAARPPGYEELGRAVRAVHAATRVSGRPDVRTLGLFEEIRSDLEWPTSWSGSSESEEMSRRLASLEAEWPSAAREDPLGTVLVLGDVHADNAIATEEGLVLIDLESAGFGPASWDFAPLAVGVRRYGLPRERYEEFARGYGAEPGEWPGFEVMCRIYELLVTAWAMRCGSDSPEMEAEATIRVEGLLTDANTPWTLL